MKNINELTKGQSVIFSANSVEFKVKKIDVETNTVFLHIEDVSGSDRKTDAKNVFPVTEHVKEVSKIAKEKRDAIKSITPFGITINEKIMNKLFMGYWITMCEAEGDEKALETAKADFELFITAIKDRIETLNNLNIYGIRFIAPMMADMD